LPKRFSAIGVLAYATLLLAACDRAPTPATDVPQTPKTSMANDPLSGVKAAPSDAPKESFVKAGVPDAGSAVGGTAGGNIVNPDAGNGSAAAAASTNSGGPPDNATPASRTLDKHE
jgi:hypothetical protein